MASIVPAIRPRAQAANLGNLRGRLLTSVFPTIPGIPANSPVAPSPAPRTRAQAAVQQSAASRAAQAVATHLAANPVKPVAAPVRSTRANSQLDQSAGTINTNYVASAAAQGYAGVTPPDIFRGARLGQPGIPQGLPFQGLGRTPTRGPTNSRESFYNNVFVPNAAQQRASLFSLPVPGASAILGQPLAPQVGVPINTFPPRAQLLNFLFPR